MRSYKRDNTDWREIARKVLPTLPARLHSMQEARNNILACYESVYQQASRILGVNYNIVLVVYVGIGCGAGWATTYGRQPAVLLGLENIAEEEWHTKTKIRRLIFHELGHIYHMVWRDEWEEFEERA